MTILFVLACALGALLALAKTMNVFLADDGSGSNAVQDDLERLRHLQRAKDKVIQDLRVLELEFSTHKVSDADFLYFRQKFEETALHVIGEMNEIRGGDAWEDTVDAAVLSSRGSAKPDAATVAQLTLSGGMSMDSPRRISEEGPLGERS
jgi:hypothetical protein